MHDRAQRREALAGARNNLQKFYASQAGPKLIEQRFAEVAAWAKRRGIPTDRILVGEFGVLRHQSGTPGARCEDRVRWLADVRSAAEGKGFAWAYFNYDGPFAIIRDDTNRQLDSDILVSLGLKHVLSNGGC